MKIERTKNATRSMVVGTMLKIYQMIIPFLMRTAMIYFMGVQYLGLNSLFTSILQVLNLAELGVGSAMVFSMYKPIAKDDRATICALMKLYRKYYRAIGAIIAVAGCLITPFIPNLISGDVPSELDVRVLYLLNLAATVMTYWLFAYKNCLLQAYQRTDISSIVTIVTNSIQYGIQLWIVIYSKNYYLYVIVILLCQILNNIITAVVVGRLFPEYAPEGELTKEEVKKINGRIRDLFTGKLGGVILNSADTIVISAFLGLTVLAVYQNYYFILTSIIGFVEIIITSTMAGLGNSFVTDTNEKKYADFEKFTFLFMWLTGFCTICFFCLYQPFMEIWVGKDLMLDFKAVLCFCSYFYIYELNRLLNLYKDAAGLWHEDRFRPLITSLLNLGMNLLLVNFWGIYGVLLSTVFSIGLVGIPWLLHNTFTVIFERRLAIRYISRLFIYTGVTVLLTGITYFICEQVQFQGFGGLLLRLGCCIVIPNVIYFAIFKRTPQCRQGIVLIDRMTKGKIKLEKMLYR